MLFCSIKYERPDLSNSVREMSKCMDKVMYGTYQEMLCVIKFALDTKEFCLKIQQILTEQFLEIESIL
jgi:hypothetical protein